MLRISSLIATLQELTLSMPVWISRCIDAGAAVPEAKISHESEDIHVVFAYAVSACSR